MNIDAFILGIITGIILYFVLRVFQRNRARYYQEIEMNQMQEIEKVSAMFIPLHVRMMDDVLYAYNADDGAFIASGTDLGTLRINFMSMYKGKKGVVVSSDENCAHVFNDLAVNRANIKMVNINGEIKND